MLVLRRKEGQWVEIKHKSGDILKIRVYDISKCMNGHLSMAFDDDSRHFTITRPERTTREES